MIAIAAPSGALLKTIPEPGGTEEVFGFHRLFGIVNENACLRRMRFRKLHGQSLRGDIEAQAASGWAFRFRLLPGFRVEAIEGCSAARSAEGGWELETPLGSLRLTRVDPASPAAVDRSRLGARPIEEDRRTILGIALAALALALLFVALPSRPISEESAPPVIEPVTVKIKTERQRPVVVPAASSNALPEVVQQKVRTQQARRAIQQQLGFLGLLGRKDLKKALGGAPTALKDASHGAGAGGKEGSGGELLVGLGQGLKRATVGNSGVAGLGGVGTKGAGGGAGGYGNAAIGSGEGGRALSAMPISQELVLEGGLDRAVIQATIAKYLSQIRACYEQGLAQNPGLSGQVTLQFEVGAGGGVNYARVAKSSLGSSQVEQCIAGKVTGWQFPKPLGGVSVKVSYPFLLRPAGS